MLIIKAMSNDLRTIVKHQIVYCIKTHIVANELYSQVKPLARYLHKQQTLIECSSETIA